MNGETLDPERFVLEVIRDNDRVIGVGLLAKDEEAAKFFISFDYYYAFGQFAQVAANDKVIGFVNCNQRVLFDIPEKEKDILMEIFGDDNHSAARDGEYLFPDYHKSNDLSGIKITLVRD